MATLLIANFRLERTGVSKI